MVREERDREGQQVPSIKVRGTENRPRLQPFSRTGIAPETQQEMHERAWVRNRGKAKRLQLKDREVSARERRVKEEEAAAGHRGSRIIPDPEGDTTPKDEEGRLPSSKRAGGDSAHGGHRRGKRRCVMEGKGKGATGAPRPSSPRPGAHTDGQKFGIVATAPIYAEGAGNNQGVQAEEVAE